MMRRVAGVWLVVSAVSVAHLVGQSPDELRARGRAAGVDAQLLDELVARAGTIGLETRATVALLTPPVQLAEAGLPSGMVMQKALEGLAKRVDPARIATVLEQMQGNIRRAGALADPWLARPDVRDALQSPPRTAPGVAPRVRAAILESVGLALFRGASELSVQSLLDRVPGRAGAGPVSPLGLAVAVEVLPDLLTSNQPPDLAADLVIEALRSGFEPRELRELPAALEAAERRGQLPAEAVARGALAQLRADLPAAAVLQNLFSGEFPGSVPFELPPGLENARRAKGKGPPGP